METSERARILSKRKTRIGWSVTTIPYTAVPDYDFEAASKGLDDAGRRMELEIDWTATLGRRVFPTFSRELHVSKEDLEFDPTLTLHAGWDMPGTPAFVPCQLNRYGQLLVFPSLCPPESDESGVWEFACRVADHLQREYASPHGLALEDLKIVHVGDPAGQHRPVQTRMKRQEVHACFEILRKGSKVYLGEDDRGEPVYEERPGWGWRVTSGAMELTTRLEAIRARLSMILPGSLSAIVVDHREEVLKGAFLGNYAFAEYGDGTYSREPMKNHASHGIDALGYAITRLSAQPRVDKKPDEDEPARPPVVSQASNRSWR